MLKQYIKRGASATFFYGASSLVVRGMSFLFLPYFLSHLTLTEFGIWDFYQLFFSTGTLLLSSCAATSMIRFYVLYKEDPLKQAQSIGNSLLFVLSTILVFSLVVFGLLNYSVQFSVLSNFLYTTLASVACFALYTMVLSYLRVKEKLWYYSIVFCGQNFLAIALTLCGVHYKLGIASFFYANLVSFAFFVPFFMYLFIRFSYFSLEVFKKQLFFSVPLLVYNLIYLSFFIVDKLFIKKFLGYDDLGLYGILWRFGAVFQVITIAMTDAWYITIYNAQKEDGADFLIAKLINYYSIILTTCCLYAILGSYCAIKVFFPVRYYYLTCYLPLFFLPLLFIEIARLFQTAFGLSTKTIYMPFLSLITVSLQMVLLFFLVEYKIWGVFLANSLAFLCYALLCYVVSLKVYPHQLIDKEKTTKLLIWFTCCIGTLHLVFNNSLYALFISCFVALVWPVVLWNSGIIDDYEKERITVKVGLLASLFYRKPYFLKKNK